MPFGAVTRRSSVADMRAPRRAEDLPRLLAALGTDPARVRAALSAGEPARQQHVSLEHWVPTSASLARASRPAAVPFGRGLGVADDHDQRSPVQGGPDGGGPDQGGPPIGVAGRGDQTRRPAGRHRRPRGLFNASIPGSGPPVASIPESLREARYAVSRRAVLAVLLVAVVAVGLFLTRVGLARAVARPAPVGSPGVVSTDSVIVSRVSSTFGPSATASAPEPSGQAAPSTAGTAGKGGPVVVVHVVGQVRRPGVYSLPAGRRVADALSAAGGATALANLGAINLARPLVDGEQVRVPRPGETVTTVPVLASGSAPAATTADALVNLNSADLTTLDGLPGVGPVLAQRILDWRTAHGSFTSVQELGEVSGIGEKILAQLAPKVTV